MPELRAWNYHHRYDDKPIKRLVFPKRTQARKYLELEMKRYLLQKIKTPSSQRDETRAKVSKMAMFLELNWSKIMKKMFELNVETVQRFWSLLKANASQVMNMYTAKNTQSHPNTAHLFVVAMS